MDLIVTTPEQISTIVAQAVREALAGLPLLHSDLPHAALVGKAYLTEAEAAVYCELAETTLRTRRSRGKGPEYIKDGGRVIYKREALDHYLNSRTVKIHGC